MTTAPLYVDASTLILRYSVTPQLMLLTGNTFACEYFISEGQGEIRWSATINGFGTRGRLPISFVQGKDAEASPAFMRQLELLVQSAYDNVRLLNRFRLGKV